jgi:hypothetical protein
VFPIFAEQTPVKKVERLLGVLRAFHVEANEPSKRPGLVQNPNHVGMAEVFGNIDTHLGKLDRDIHFLARGSKAVEHVEILIPGSHGLRLHRHAFAQKIERRCDTAPRQLTRCSDRLTDRFPGHEPGGKLSGQAIAPDKIEHSSLLR